MLIPLISCNKAADLLIEWFGPEDLKAIVGGEKWWQVRGLDGVDGEWITEKEYLSPEKEIKDNKKLSTDEEDILRMEHLDTVMVGVSFYTLVRLSAHTSCLPLVICSWRLVYITVGYDAI